MLGDTRTDTSSGRDGHARGLCELCRSPQGLLRRTWRDYLYILQCEGSNRMVLGQAGEDPFFPRRALGPQYSQQDGVTERRDDRLGPFSAQWGQYAWSDP